MARAKKRTRARDNKFFAALAEDKTIGEAAKIAGYSRTCIYEYAQEDPDFKERFEDAKLDIVERLEKEADRRALQGVDDYKSLKDKDGNHRIIKVKRYSDSLLQFRLRALRPDVYRENYSADEVELEAPPIAVNIQVREAVGEVEVTRGRDKP